MFPLPNDARDPLSMFSILPSKDAPSSNSLKCMLYPIRINKIKNTSFETFKTLVYNNNLFLRYLLNLDFELPVVGCVLCLSWLLGLRFCFEDVEDEDDNG